MTKVGQEFVWTITREPLLKLCQEFTNGEVSRNDEVSKPSRDIILRTEWLALVI